MIELPVADPGRPDTRSPFRLLLWVARNQRGTIAVAIAHRLHTAHDPDRVAVVENGLLEELGTHDELVAGGGAYAALWESWQR